MRPDRVPVAANDPVYEALSFALDVLVGRWHEWTEDGRTLAEFMELTDEEYTRFAEEGPKGYAAALALRGVSS